MKKSCNQETSIFYVSALALGALGIVAIASPICRSGVTQVMLLVCSLAISTISVVSVFSCFSQESPESARNIGLTAFVVIVCAGSCVAFVNLESLFSSKESGESIHVSPQHKGEQLKPLEQRRPSSAVNMQRTQKATQDKTASATAAELKTPTHKAISPELAKKLDAKIVAAEKRVENKQYEEADKMFSSVLRIIDEKLSDHMDIRGRLVAKMARARFTASRSKDAAILIEDHINRLKKSLTTTPLEMASFLELAGSYWGNSGDFSKSIERFKYSVSILEEMDEDPRRIASTHAKIAISYAKIENKPMAQKALNQAVVVIKEKMPDDEISLQRMESIAKEYGL